MKGRGMYDVLAQNKVASSGLFAHRKALTNKPKLCWKCQKESKFEEGAYLKIQPNFHQYICKPCMDIKREKQQKEEQCNQSTP